jgi:hypothetical protein
MSAAGLSPGYWDGEKMARLCAEFGISRKTGYKIFERYQRLGVRGLTDRSRRPYRYANQLPPAVETLIVRLKREYPSWGYERTMSQRTCAPLPACRRSSTKAGPARPRPSDRAREHRRRRLQLLLSKIWCGAPC